MVIRTMANLEHELILRQGVKEWNKWRKNNFNIWPDLSNTHFRYENFIFADFSYVNFSGVDLRNSNLTNSNLSHANFRDVKLNSANLSNTNLSQADFDHAILDSTNFSDADLSGAKLKDANLRNADLHGTNLRGAILNHANIQHAICSNTVFAAIDLSETIGLDTVQHVGPSTLGMDTYFKSKGEIPEIFMRGCGVPETLITFLPSMLEKAIQFYSCFISYSHTDDDKAFAKRLHDRLQGIGIRCWLDEHQLKPGDELHKTIYEGIRVYDKVILCCSETALKSWWVEKEFKNAISKEEDYTETVLIPITLDDYVFKQSADNWTVGEIKRRFVQNFSNWKEHDAFEQAFKKVVEALKTKDSQIPHPQPKLPRRE